MSSLLSFNDLFGQPSDPPTHPAQACRYSVSFREAEASLIECSARYGGGGGKNDDGGGSSSHRRAKVEAIDTRIPRSTIPRNKKKPVKRSDSVWSDCYAPSAAALVYDDDDDEADNGGVDGGDGEKAGDLKSGSGSGEGASSRASSQDGEEDDDKDPLYVHSIRVTSQQPQEHESGASSRRPQDPQQSQEQSQQQSRPAQPQSPKPQPPLVLLHGYANGSLYYYRNLHGLSTHFPTIYSVDMLGWGLSSRPPFTTRDDSVKSAEDFFVDSLEAWRIANGIDKMILGGHSLGGYVAVAYCERHPENIDRLLLLSPVGVQDVPADPVAGPNVPLVHKMVYGVARTFWRSGWTPGAVIRSVSEWKGKMGVARYVDNRLPAVTCREEREALIGYLYNNAVLEPSGEGCLNRLLRPGAYAIDPCVHRIPRLKVGKVVFIYGEKDWMDPTAGLEVERICRERREAAAAAEAAGGGGECSLPPEVTVHAVRNAGHLLMIENWQGFNAAVILACGGTLDDDEHRPGSFIYKKAAAADAAAGNKALGRQKSIVSTVESEVTEESSQESVEIDMNRRVVVSCE